MKTKAVNQRSEHRFRKCFISAPFGCNVGAVLEIFNELGVSSRRLDSLRPGKSITAAIKNELKRSDFVCVILARGYNAASNLYELGMAVGLGKPTIILAESDVAIPVDVAEWPFGRISLEKPETIRVAVSSLLQSLERQVQKAAAKTSSQLGAAESYAPPPLRIEKEPVQIFDIHKALTDTILKKIEGCAVFIADLTFVGDSMDGLTNAAGEPRRFPKHSKMGI